jgi:hypothetical protein
MNNQPESETTKASVFNKIACYIMTTMTTSLSLFLVDHACYKPPSNLQVKFEQFM